jgi:alkane 1-monooxygenase
MPTLTAIDPALGPVSYRDKKRWLWLASMLYPLLALSGLGLYVLWGNEWLMFIPIVGLYFGVSVLDALCGTDRSNPPEAVVPQLDDDPYYRTLVMLTVPMHFIVFLVIAIAIGTQDFSLVGYMALTISAGLYSGLGINTAHELGHKKTELERVLARIVLAVPAYGHFCVEHNRGHHRYVATADDPASSKMGENIYAFAWREIPGACRRGWLVEKERLARQDKSVWSVDNEILQSYALSLLMQGSLIAAFGVLMIPFLVLHNFYAWWQLTSANYVEHYGLLRVQKPNGQPEHCQPHHSWNADYIVSNLLLYHLERHSDHHAHPTRRYQSLRSFPDLPTLPNGYFGMFLAALVPPLWYHLMDKRLLALPHIAGDFAKVNVLPAKREKLMARYSHIAPQGALI